MDRKEETLLATGSEFGLRVVDLRGKLPVHQSKKWGTRPVAGIKGIVFHHGATDASFAGVSNYHVGPNHISQSGLPSISYSLGIDVDGAVSILNDFNCRTYSHGSRKHPGDENSDFLGILVRGNLWSQWNPEGHDPTPEQMKAAYALFDWFQKYWGIDAWGIFGHYHFGKAACPGAAVQSVVEEIRASVEGPKLPTWHGFNPAKNRQEALQRLGLYKGRIDGIWGRLSNAALLQFEAKFNLNVNGQWDSVDEATMVAVLSDAGKLA